MPSRARAWVEVDLDAVRLNLQTVRRRLPASVGIVPMLKADAYGLGADQISQFLRDVLAPDGPWAFGIAAVEEGEALRRLGWSGRILLSSPIPPQQYLRAAEAELTLAISELPALERWADAARRVKRKLAFHLEVDTGMGRTGFQVHDPARWAREVLSTAGDVLRWEGSFTHFHSADHNDLEATRRQWSDFQKVTDMLPEDVTRRRYWVFHAANSAASIRFPESAGGLVRPGIFLFGGRVGDGAVPAQAVSLRARLALVREVEPGSTLGYGATYTAMARERWGTLAIGYGDGLMRSLVDGGGSTLVNGRRVPLIGRISMDMATVDLTDTPDARAGDVVTLVGRDGDAEITIDEVATRSGTISYEVLTGLAPRLPRVYVSGGNTGAPEAVVSQVPIGRREHRLSGSTDL